MQPYYENMACLYAHFSKPELVDGVGWWRRWYATNVEDRMRCRFCLFRFRMPWIAMDGFGSTGIDGLWWSAKGWTTFVIKKAAAAHIFPPFSTISLGPSSQPEFSPCVRRMLPPECNPRSTIAKAPKAVRPRHPDRRENGRLKPTWPPNPTSRFCATLDPFGPEFLLKG